MNKNILITGGGGYVGSYLVPFLLKKDFHITVYDRFYFNSNYLPNHKNLKIINGDIRDVTKFENYTALESICCHALNPVNRAPPGRIHTPRYRDGRGSDGH